MGDVGIRATEASAVGCRREDDEMAMVVMMMRARVGQRRESADGLCLLGEGDGRVSFRELVKACFVRRRRVFQALYRPADPCIGGCEGRVGGCVVAAGLEAFLSFGALSQSSARH
jgi:hypothetical protein